MWNKYKIFMILIFGCNQNPVPKPVPEIGRYQLQQVYYTQLLRDKKGELHEMEIKEVFKIDTVTGKVESFTPITLGDPNSKSFWSSTGD